MSTIKGNTFLDRVFQTALGRIFVALIQTILVSLALLLVFVVPRYIEIQVLKYTVVLLVGLTAGFSSRRFLEGHSLFLKIMTAALAVVLSLMVQHTLSKGFIGAQPFLRRGRFLDWDSLIQLGTALLGSLLVILAYRSRQRTPGPAAFRQEPVVRPLEESRANNGHPTAQVSRMEIKENTIAEPPKLALASPTKIAKPASKTKKRKGKSREIHLIGEEEHTCPYCLDRVEKGDPRGVKVCPICKTWHHADCWGITGACQIPHMHKS
jgi:hypothetical protein